MQKVITINNNIDIKEEVKSINPDKIDFSNKEGVRNIIVFILNFIEQLLHLNQQLKEENQNLKDEMNFLKGEKSQPKFKPNVPQKENIVPTKEESKDWSKESKKLRIKIDKTDPRSVDKSILPPDAVHKGYRSVIVQNILFKTENIEYILERYYSPSEKKTYEAKLPEEVDGEFGAELKAFIHNLYFACRVPEKKIWNMLTDMGIIISEGQISNILTKEKQDEFTKEKEDVFKAGMEHSEYVHADDSGARHKSINHHVHVICDALFTAFFITPSKSKKEIRNILGLKENEQLDKIIITDDAKQYYYITILHALCWIHEIRPYRKLTPFVDWHREKLNQFLIKMWNFYEMLKEYKKSPNEKQKYFLEQKFDELFSTKTGYEELDRRIELTKKQKAKLLLVLEHPEIPLHNNPAEIALREMVIKKKISYGTKSEYGRIAWENMMSMLDTCRKHNVSFFSYLKDIFSRRLEMPRLADLIVQKASANSTSH